MYDDAGVVLCRSGPAWLVAFAFHQPSLTFPISQTFTEPNITADTAHLRCMLCRRCQYSSVVVHCSPTQQSVITKPATRTASPLSSSAFVTTWAEKLKQMLTSAVRASRGCSAAFLANMGYMVRPR